MDIDAPRTTASAVSAVLRRAGARPVPRGRPGYHVTGSRLGTVTVTADWDDPATSAARAAEAAVYLTDAGYTATPNPYVPATYTIAKEAPTP